MSVFRHRLDYAMLFDGETKMSRKTILLYVVFGLLVGTMPAWAAMSDVQANALAMIAYQKSGSKRGVAALAKLESAAKGGVRAAQMALGGYFYSKHHLAKAIHWYKKAAEQGDDEAENNLGFAYGHGLGVRIDYTKARYWFTKSAEQGNAGAQNNLGDLFYFGKGVPKNYVKANYWYKKAAKQGLVDAQNNLAFDYYHGHGVSQNTKRAIDWWKKAAAQGSQEAVHNMKIAEHGSAPHH